ncbi:MAG TPA: FAD-binding oxidoreductase, partial [Rubrobacteraceae bacterium]|nr:FAD-binding oxidoreductase [Rubrobacteraceae bacterium]
MTTVEQGQKPWVEALREELGDAVSSESQVLQAHSNDEGYRYENRPPECVVYARNKEDVISVLRVARKHAVPVVARGAASSLEGNVLPIRGGISLDLTRMNRVISVDPQSMTVTVEAGVRRKELNRRLGEHGLFLSVDPGADATVGGMAGTNASGSNALKYGSFRNQVLGMEVVLADGRVLR